MQVRHIASDGKIYIDSDSFLPGTLLGNHVHLFCDDPSDPSNPSAARRRVSGTVEAIGAIHFAPPEARSGKKGIAPEELYVELGVHGSDGKDQVDAMGIRPGDTVILDRPIAPCAVPGTFSGAYLDNGIGCFVVSHLATLVAESQSGGDGALPALDNIRCIFSYASHEEIGRFGSRVIAADIRPDILIAVDVNHDYSAAPSGMKSKRMPEIR